MNEGNIGFDQVKTSFMSGTFQHLTGPKFATATENKLLKVLEGPNGGVSQQPRVS